MFTLAFWLSLVMATAGCAGLILAGKGYWQGWALGLAVQPVWAVFAIVTEGYGLLITCVMYGTVYTKNLLKWRKEQKKDPYEDAVNLGIMSPNQAREVLKFPTVVLGGDYYEGLAYVRQNKLSSENLVIVTNYRQLEGLRFRSKDVIRTGKWYDHPDIDQIAEIIARNTVLYKE